MHSRQAFLGVGLVALNLLLSPGNSHSARLMESCSSGAQHLVQPITVERFQDGAWAAPCVFMARTEAEWNDLMEKMLDRGELVFYPAPNAPHVNWKRQNVIVVSLGLMPTDGYGVEIRRVNKMGRTALLDIEVTIPADDLR